MSGNDVILQAQTGSGKTLCFALPLLSNIDPGHSSIQAVVVVPTRELGFQVASVLKQLSSGSPVKIVTMTVVEGSHNRRQALWASAEPPHIVVGNPRSLHQLVQKGKLRLNSVNTIVVDEVDACLRDIESKKDLHRLLSRHLSNSYVDFGELERQEIKQNLALNSNIEIGNLAEYEGSLRFNGHRQTIFCSATIPQRRYFAQLCYRNGWTETVPEVINISNEKMVPDNIKHEMIVCDPELRIQLTSHLLKEHFRNKTQFEGNQCVVFVDCEQKIGEYANFLLEKLIDRGVISSNDSELSAKNWISVLSSNMNIEDRRQSMLKFKNSESKILVCTSLAARGIDIPSTSLVIQMSLPITAEEYLHRSGRTGRFYRPGIVISLIQKGELFVVKRYMNELHIEVTQRTLQAKN
jgi:superfamily II DNA/RNA helicase